MDQPILRVTDAARSKLQELVESGKLAESSVRLTVEEDGGGFLYKLEIVKPEARRDDDAVVSSVVDFLLDPLSTERIQGATLDHVDEIGGAGFKFDNPNQPGLLEKPLAARIQRVIEDQVNPMVAGHGGRVKLVDVVEGRVYLELGGGCQGCGMASATLREGIEHMLREAVPEITEILDTTDHSAGENPYY